MLKYNHLRAYIPTATEKEIIEHISFKIIPTPRVTFESEPGANGRTHNYEFQHILGLGEIMHLTLKLIEIESPRWEFGSR